MRKNLLRNILIISIYYFYLFLTAYFYEVDIPNKEQPIPCGIGYLIFGIPFFTIIIVLISVLLLFLINKTNKLIWISSIILPTLVWIYFYGDFLIDFLEIIFG